MNVTHFILATAGHVDHGKSALVKALTGTDPDRLPEEKQRGITIDLGFAELPLLTKDGGQISLGIVDVPGHEDFIRNMIAGVGSIDLGLLIVAADDGWMPQTEEHFQILNYLGVTQLVVAITKSDIGDADAVATQVRAELGNSAFKSAAIVRTSANSGEGLEELKAALARALATAAPPADYGKPRLPIDRVFTLRGIGTVMTGTLTGGTLKTGETVWLQPAAIQARVRSVQSHNREVTEAAPGTRTALSLPEIETGDSPRAAKRGDMITNLSAPVRNTIDVLLCVSARHHGNTALLRNNAKVDVHHGTARVRAVVKLFEQDELAPGESALAQLRLDEPILSFYQDRFVLRDTAQKRTLAGGTVLDPNGSRKRAGKNRQLALLRARAARPEDLDVALLTKIERDEFAHLASLLEKSPWSADQIAEAARRLAEQKKIIRKNSLVAHPAAWEELRKRGIGLIDQAHRENPQRPGLDLASLRAHLSSSPAEAVDALLADLAVADFIRKGETIARRSHEAELPDALKAPANDILRQLAEKPFDPPALKAAALSQDARKALQFLVTRGQVIEIDAGVLLLGSAFEKMKAMVVNFLHAKPAGASASEIRQHLQTSRRVIIPLLEYLDRKKLTQRHGDLRKLVN